MKFSQDFIEKVREASNLVDIVGGAVALRRVGRRLTGLCPFHAEKSPSFSVDEDKQVYHCFGCKKAGNVYTFVQEHHGMRFPEAVEFLAGKAAIPIPAEAPGVAMARSERADLLEVNQRAARFFHQRLLELPPGHEARAYLARRGLTDDLVRDFQLGYAPDAWGELVEHLVSARAPIRLAERLGLVRSRAGGRDGYYDMFRHRLMFPIFSTTKACVGFGGRVLNAEQTPKYLNSIDSPVFHKGQVFYGLDHAAKHVRAEDEAIVVEGYMDWLALAKASVRHAVATLGTALTAEHAKSIKKYTSRVLLLFDGDAAGRSAAERSLPILLGEGLMVRGLFLPDGLDPDDFLKERGEPALRAVIGSAPDLFDLLALERWGEAKGSPSGKVQVLDELAPVLAKVADPRMRRLYANNLANTLSVDVRLVDQSLRQLAGAVTSPIVSKRAFSTETAPTTPVVEPAPDAKIELAGVPRAELDLLNVCLIDEKFYLETVGAGVAEQFAHPGAKAAFARISALREQMPNKFASLSAILVGEVNPVGSLTRHLVEPFTGLSTEALTKLLRDCIKRVKVNFLRTKSRDLVSGLRVGDPSGSTETLEQIMNVQRSRRSLSRDS